MQTDKLCRDEISRKIEPAPYPRMALEKLADRP